MSKKELTFIEHLEELRIRIIFIIIVFAVLFFICFSQSEKILHWIKQPVIPLIFIHPAEVIFVRLKVAFYFALLLCYPVIGYQVFQFIKPAISEIKIATFFYVFSLVLFIAGIFIYKFWIFPYVWRFLLKFSIPGVIPRITINNYVSVFFALFLIFIFLFQLPIILISGVGTGIIPLGFLKRRRREIYVLSFILSAILTPPDVLSQICLALPLILVLELSILISRFCRYNIHKQRR